MNAHDHLNWAKRKKTFTESVNLTDTKTIEVTVAQFPCHGKVVTTTTPYMNKLSFSMVKTKVSYILLLKSVWATTSNICQTTLKDLVYNNPFLCHNLLRTRRVSNRCRA